MVLQKKLSGMNVVKIIFGQINKIYVAIINHAMDIAVISQKVVISV